MKLRLNGLIVKQIEWAKEPNTAIFNKSIGIIRDLEKLYHLDTLSEEELKALIAKYYLWDPISSYPDDADIERISKKILKTNNVDWTKVSTDIIAMVSIETKELSFLDAIVYYDKDSDFDTNRQYTFTELQELIKARKIVVETLEWSDEEVTIDKVNKCDLTMEENLPTIDKIDQRNFWGYNDIMLPLIKKRLQKKRVNKDIMRIINSMRTRLRIRQYNLVKERADLQSQIKLIEQSIIINRSEYQDCSSKLEELEELKK